MRRFRKILKWIGIVLLLVICGLTITVMARQNLTYDRPYPAIHASTDTSIIARGKYLVFGAAHCADCHSKANNDSLFNAGVDIPLTGGVLFDLPVGEIYSRNITPDSETGIGGMSDEEIARALRYGVHANGKAVFNFMPFHNTSDEDLRAILSYLRAQKPVRNEVPAHSLNVVGKVVNAFLVKPVGPDGEVPVHVNPDTTAAYGLYLANSVANCSGCHTQRDLSGKAIGAPLAGGQEIEGFITPNITPDPSGRIFEWSEETFLRRFRMGKQYAKSPMPWSSFGRMSDNDIKAIYRFLKAVPPVKNEVKSGPAK